VTGLNAVFLLNSSLTSRCFYSLMHLMQRASQAFTILVLG
jgi:hypothetical protein